MSGVRQFAVLWRKNLLLKTRRPCATCFEFTLPIVLFILLAYVRAVYKIKTVGPFLFETEPIFPLGGILFPEAPTSNVLTDVRSGNINATIEGVDENMNPTPYGERYDVEKAQREGPQPSEPRSAIMDSLERELVCQQSVADALGMAMEPLLAASVTVNGSQVTVDEQLRSMDPDQAVAWVESLLAQIQSGELRQYVRQADDLRRDYLASQMRLDAQDWAGHLDNELRNLAAELDMPDLGQAAARSRGEDWVHGVCNSSSWNVTIPRLASWIRTGSSTVAWSDRMARLGDEVIRWDGDAVRWANCTLSWESRTVDCLGQSATWGDRSVQWPAQAMNVTWDDMSVSFGGRVISWANRTVSWDNFELFRFAPVNVSEYAFNGSYLLETAALAQELQHLSQQIEASGFASWLRGVNVSSNVSEAFGPVYSFLNTMGTSENPGANVREAMDALAELSRMFNASDVAEALDDGLWWLSHFVDSNSAMADLMLATSWDQAELDQWNPHLMTAEAQEMQTAIARRVYRELVWLQQQANNDTLREQIIVMVNETARDVRFQTEELQRLLESWNGTDFNATLNSTEAFESLWGYMPSNFSWTSDSYELNLSGGNASYFIEELRQMLETFRNATATAVSAPTGGSTMGRLRDILDRLHNSTVAEIDELVIPDMEQWWQDECPRVLNATRVGDFFARMQSGCPWYRSQMRQMNNSNFSGQLAAFDGLLGGLDTESAMNLVVNLESAVEAVNLTEVRTVLSRTLDSLRVGGGSGDAATLVQDLRNEYLRSRGLSPCANPGAGGGGGGGGSGAQLNAANYLMDELMRRKIVISPNRGEARKLVDLAMVEGVISVATTGASAPSMMQDMLEMPPMRAGAAFAANMFAQDRVLYLENEAEVERYAMDHPDDVLVALVFRNTDPETGDFPEGQVDVEYAIRTHAQLLPDTSRVLRLSRRAMFGVTLLGGQQYLELGFAQLQEVLGRAVVRLQALRDLQSEASVGSGRRLQESDLRSTELGRNILANERTELGRRMHVGVEQFPSPQVELDGFIRVIQHTLPMFMILGWIYSVSLLVREMVYEKQERLRDVMRIMGLKTWVYWTSWMASSMAQMSLLALMLTVLMKISNVLKYSSFSVVFFFFFLFTAATVSLSLLISSFFSRAKVAAACGGLTYYCIYIPYSLYGRFEPVMNMGQKNAMCLFSSTGMAMGVSHIARWELVEIGVQWDNFFSPPPVTLAGSVPTDGHSLGHICLMFVVDVFLYQALAWYIEKVNPGTMGLPQPFYFPLLPSYWRGVAKETGGYQEEDGLAERDSNQREGFVWEAPIDGLEATVQIRGLEKTFPNGKRALNGVNLDMHKSTIVGLLGHNGAGKSTTMAILTGLYAPTKGDVRVNGVSVKRDSHGVRKQLGVCLQHNALYEYFTVEEHLNLFCCLKSVPYRQVRSEVDSLLSATGLQPKRHVQSRALSGGMKRKLSIGIALAGGSKVVTLDEPTAGVDATSRRDIWQMLSASKADRTILLSTHFMDEADILSDRIAIIAEGELTAIGSSMFLKRHFTDGYILTVVLGSSDSSRVTPAIREVIPEAACAGSRGREISYVLPFSAQGKFPALFAMLQDSQRRTALGVDTYGLSAASMEEVFLRASSVHEAGLHGIIRNSASQDDSTQEGSDSGPSTPSGQEAGATASAVAKEDSDSVRSGQLNEAGNNAVTAEEAAADRPRSPQCMSSGLTPRPDSAASMATPTQVQAAVVEDAAPAAEGSPNASITMTARDVDTRRLTGCKLYMQQFMALFIKRAHSVKRDRKAWASQLVLPAFFVLLALVIARIMSVKQEAPAILLNTEMYIGSINAGSSMRSINTNNILVSDVNPSNMSSRIISAFDDALLPHDRLEHLDHDTMLSQHLLENCNKMPNTLGAVSIRDGEQPDVTLWFDNIAYHSIPVMMNMWNNARFRLMGYEDAKMKVWNHPLPKTEALLTDELTGNNQVFTDLWVAITIILAMGFIPASFVVYFVHEKATSGKHQQLLSGINPALYWIASYCWDMVNFLIPLCLCFIIFAGFGVEAYSGDNAPAVFVLLLIYGACMSPCMYCLEPLFSVPSTAYVTLICVNIFTGTISTLSTSVLDLYENEAPELKPINVFCKAVFPWLLPNYCLGRGLMEIAMNHYMNFVSEEFGICFRPSGCYVNPLSYEVVGEFLVPLVIMTPVWLTLRLLLEWGFFLGTVRRYVAKLRSKNGGANKAFADEDEEVLAESARVETVVNEATSSGLRTADNLIIHGLEKSFAKTGCCGRTKGLFHAVRGLNVGVPAGECFGLLGVNGAGKTTTMRMITGDTDITAGDVLVGGNSVHTHKDKARQHLGYCPQFDALPDKLTVKETVALYARIRGIPPSKVQQTVMEMIQCMCLEAHQNQTCEYLSGGNKRKLSTALALIGDPDVVLLDEPSTGVDVGARRFLWDVIGSLRQRGHAIVLTSHAMEECQVLCTRLTIMVHGQMRCLGSPTQLKAKYGGGYTLTVKVELSNKGHAGKEDIANISNAVDNTAVEALDDRSPSKDESTGTPDYQKAFGEPGTQIRSFMASKVPEATLAEESVGLLRYRLGGKNEKDIPLAEVFKLFEDSMKKGGELYGCVADYSMSQTSLEEVFLHFSQEAENTATQPARSAVEKKPQPAAENVESSLHQLATDADTSTARVATV